MNSYSTELQARRVEQAFIPEGTAIFDVKAPAALSSGHQESAGPRTNRVASLQIDGDHRADFLKRRSKLNGPGPAVQR